MSRGVIVFVAVAIVVLATVFIVLHRRPAEREETRPAPAAPPPAPPKKKVEPPPPPSAEAAPARKSPVTKAEPRPAPEPAAPTLASLKLESDIPGASVFIDRQFVGNTPLTLDKLDPGSKRVQLTAAGYDSVQKTIELAPGPNAITIRIREVSLNAKVAVMHRHGVGACEGTLVASLDGLSYQTANKGDAFQMSFAQLEQFAVDYLQKNLRVKQKGGKTWNFTDKTDNADTLFVFHRDVEAARKKLAGGYAPAR